jgi:hypothetical protein
MNAKPNDVINLEQFKEKNYGKVGTTRRDELDAGYKNFKLLTLFYLPFVNTRRIIDRLLHF